MRQHPNLKLARNIDIYVAKKNGVTYRELMSTYNLSQARIQAIVDTVESKLPNMPEIGAIVAKKVIKFERQ